MKQKVHTEEEFKKTEEEFKKILGLESEDIELGSVDAENFIAHFTEDMGLNLQRKSCGRWSSCRVKQPSMWARQCRQ